MDWIGASITLLTAFPHLTAETLYEAVAQGLRAFRDAEWDSDIGTGLTTSEIMVKQPRSPASCAREGFCALA